MKPWQSVCRFFARISERKFLIISFDLFRESAASSFNAARPTCRYFRVRGSPLRVKVRRQVLQGEEQQRR